MRFAINLFAKVFQKRLKKVLAGTPVDVLLEGGLGGGVIFVLRPFYDVWRNFCLLKYARNVLKRYSLDPLGMSFLKGAWEVVSYLF